MGEYLQTIREQVGRVWESLSTQNRILFIAAPSLVLIMLLVTIFMVSQPEMVTLVRSSDETYLSDITQFLDAQNYEWESSTDNQALLVDSSNLPRIRMGLAQEGLAAGASEGPGYTLFDTTRLGMTDRLFDIQKKRAIEDELARTIRLGTRYEGVRVTISMSQPVLFQENEVAPSASVKINSRQRPTEREVNGIQYIVANAVPNLDPHKVVVLDSKNVPLGGAKGEQNEVIGEAITHQEVKRNKEDDVIQKIHANLAEMLGPDDYTVFVDLKLDWEKETIVNKEIYPDTQSPISEKTYNEESKSMAIAGEPGVDTNVQDTGIGSSGADSLGTTLEESIVNSDYSRSQTNIERETGEVDSYHISVMVNHTYNNETDVWEPRDTAELDIIRELIVSGLGLEVDPGPTGAPRDSCIVKAFEFDRSGEDELTRKQRIERIQKILLQYVLPVIVLAVVFWLLYKYLQRAFAPKPIEEVPAEEVPIEPVTESRELTLAQLGLAEFGDIASLPAEEQRRLKMQEHVVRYAQEKPEEVSAIIKAWLTA